jgi:hypothetical protein
MLIHVASKSQRVGAFIAASLLTLGPSSATHAQTSKPPQEGLSVYFPAYAAPVWLPPWRNPPPVGFPPEVRVNGGGIDPPPISTGRGAFFSVERFVGYRTERFLEERERYVLYQFSNGACTRGVSSRVVPRRSDEIVSGWSTYDPPPPGFDCSADYIAGQATRWTFTDIHTTVAAARRKAIDGSEYEAAALTIERDGAPWMTYFAGYRLGIVASASNWLDANRNRSVALSTWPNYPNARDNFELAKLPPPFVEGELVEYQYREGVPHQQPSFYAYAVNLEEQTAMDKMLLWDRTGRRFKTGGYVPVCRFDLPAAASAGGVASRFFSGSEQDCKALIAAPSLAAKGTAFRASLPNAATGTCPVATVPINRLYNNGTTRGLPPNHRYVGRGEDQEPIPLVMSKLGWVDEGVALCVPE